MRQIVLLSDYGNESIYIGIVKGVIHKITKNKNYIDLYHNVDKQNIVNAVFLLAKSYDKFADNSVFCCLVDPEINTERSIIIAKNSNQYFIAPDNGLLSPIISSSTQIYKLKNEVSDVPKEYSEDLITYSAAELSINNTNVIGREIHHKNLKYISVDAIENSCEVHGQIVHIDSFGNIVTNIENSHLGNLKSLEVGNQIVVDKSGSYSEANENIIFAYPGSFNTIEIGVKNSSANNRMKLNIGNSVRLIKKRDT